MLKFLICGLEHTGTTLVSDLFRQVPGLDSGFECGVLLCDTPRDFIKLNPFAKNMLSGWGLTKEELNECCKKETFAEFYEAIAGHSSAISKDTNTIFDKTPRYLASLSSVLQRCDVPIIVTYKDPRAIVFSDYKRSGDTSFHTWYQQYRGTKINYVQTAYNQFSSHKKNPRVVTVGLEDLAMNFRQNAEAIFSHVGEGFDIDYAIIDNLRYKNTRSRTVSAEIAFEYRSVLSEENQNQILEDFGKLEDWIYQ